MTRAASPATSGEDSLVPPNSWMADGRPALSRQLVNCATFGLQSAQPRSPGASTSSVLGPICVNPAELRADGLLSIQPPADSWLPNPVICRYRRSWVVAPTPITGLVAAVLPIVLVKPASPLLATTVIPAATAFAFAIWTASSRSSGNGLAPNDSLITFTWSCSTAQSIAWMMVESNAPPVPKTLRATRLAPGAMPLTRMVQPGGSGWAGLTKVLRS